MSVSPRSDAVPMAMMLYFGRDSPYSGKPAVDAYTNFPNFCCHCLRPDPQGTWLVKNSQREKLDGGVIRVHEVSVQVPLCGRCRWDIRRRDVGVLGTALAAAALALALWYWDTPKLEYLPYGAVFAVIVFFLAAVVLACLFGPKRVAYLQPDGSDIAFANPEYQRMYTGESRRGRPNDVDWRELNWR
jgi:hypothetical protein